MRSPLSRSFRLVCAPPQVPLVEGLLRAQGFSFAPEPFFPLARRLTGGETPLGSSLAARFGYIYIQDRSSMLPPLALAPERGASVLDMCASPGSKTGMLAQLVGPQGFVLANEPSGSRLATLRANLRNLNLFCSATTSYPGERLPLLSDGENGWDAILLDPPCSGWGTAEKHPRVLSLWTGEKIRPLIALQRKLLAEAARLLRPGGRLVYSTCTTNVQENEEQLHFAQEELGLRFLPLAQPPGFCLADPALPDFAGCWRIAGGPDGQGFFVALLQKPQEQENDAPPPEPHPQESPALPPLEGTAGNGFFAARWEKDSRHVGERRRYARRTPPAREEAQRVPRASLRGPYLDPDLLPPGEIAVFNATAHFLPEGSRKLPEKGFVWKAFPLGRFGSDARFDPHLRALMPPLDRVRNAGLPFLDQGDPAPILALLSGQSLPLAAPGPEIGLYFQGLPLCRLPVKGKRVMLPKFRDM